MKHLKRFLCVVLAILCCMPAIFLVALIVFEDQPPEHSSDWSKETDILLDDNEDIYQQVLFHAQQIDRDVTELLSVEYRFDKEYTCSFQRYNFYVSPNDDLPNGVLEVKVDVESFVILGMSMRYNDSKMAAARPLDLILLEDIEDCMEEKLRMLGSNSGDIYWIHVRSKDISVDAFEYRKLNEDMEKWHIWIETFDVNDFLELTPEFIEHLERQM